MKDVFQAVQVTDHVYWVGAIDWDIRDFHGYTTPRGSTYNAYLILGDQIALLDTVKAPFMGEMMSRIASVVDPQKISVLISNHSELDHSGGLPAAVEAIRPGKVYASAVGVRTLQELFHGALEVLPLKDGDRLSLGNLNLTFLETRMLHWPDSMFSYLEEEAVLFSQDAFGMHLASLDRFDDEMDPDVLKHEAATYFANILLPYAPLVTQLLARVGNLGLRLGIVAPDHGPIWRKDIPVILDAYGRWARQEPTRKAVVVYATMWHSTERMARALSEGLKAEGAEVRVMAMDHVHRSQVAYELLEAGALICGSPTLNNHLLPQMADVMTYLKGLKPRNLMGAAFGSYGWSGESVRQLNDILVEMKVEKVGEGIRVKHRPDAGVLADCYALGREIGERLRAKAAPAA